MAQNSSDDSLTCPKCEREAMELKEVAQSDYDRLCAFCIHDLSKRVARNRQQGQNPICRERGRWRER